MSTVVMEPWEYLKGLADQVPDDFRFGLKVMDAGNTAGVFSCVDFNSTSAMLHR
jgi:hypothetical protein